MPWKETCTMSERMKFVVAYLRDEYSISALCRMFGISRPTGYKWIERFLAGDVSSLEDRSRAPHSHPNAISLEIEGAVVSTRVEHRTWGPAKLRAWLDRHNPEVKWPASSTIGEILRRRGLTVPRRRSRKSPPYNRPFVGCDGPNVVWSADLKGWFTTGDGQRCDPLTISDNYSRYLLRCQMVSPANYETTQPIFETAFRQYGLPVAIRTDNGPPFATTTVGGLSKLSIWWLKLGIIPERIEPGQPAQNGRHERMHRTLKQETAAPPARTCRAQQRSFDTFRQEYNQVRPHQAINQKPPVSLYQPSNRSYPLRLPEMTYPDDMELRWVKSQGDISWKGRHIYLSETLAGEIVGFKQIADSLWMIYFGPIALANLNTRELKIMHLRRTRKPQKCKPCARSKM